MQQFEVILAESKKFQEFLQTIDLGQIRQQYSRQELKELYKELSNLKLRSLHYEISTILDQLKKEEFPQLLGVHSYPVLNEIDFLSEVEKIKLDKHLLMMRPGSYVQGLNRFIKSPDGVKKTEEFLVQKGVCTVNYFAKCPYCSNGTISNILTADIKNELIEALKNPESDLRYEKQLETLYGSCMDCDNVIDHDDLYERGIHFKPLFQLIMERDSSLDHV